MCNRLGLLPGSRLGSLGTTSPQDRQQSFILTEPEDISAAKAIGPVVRLRILATTDLHMHLTGHDYFNDRPDPASGLTRIAPLIAEARAEAAGAAVILVDNGDVLQGTPMGDVAAIPHSDLDAGAEDPGPHPAMRAFAHLGYDALGLGNHDFDFGLDALARTLADAPCPVICSNLTIAPMEGRAPGPELAPFAVIEVTASADGVPVPLKVGILSLLPPPTRVWTAHATEGRLEVGDIVDTARKISAELKALDCDVVLALAHTGLSANEPSDFMENAVIPLAELDHIDAIISGHTHRYLPGDDHDGLPSVDSDAGLVHGTPAVMPGSNGHALGIIDLTLEPDENGKYRPTGSRTHIAKVTQGRDGPAPEDHDLSTRLAPVHARTRQIMSRQAGTAGMALHSYFSLFAPDKSLALVAASQRAAIAPLLAGTMAADLPLLVAVSPARSGGLAGPRSYTEIPAGPILERHVADLCPFAEGLSVVILIGEQIRLWLEQSASMFCRIAPGSRDVALHDPAWAGHQFDVLHGIGYTVDLTAPAAFLSDGTQIGGGGRIQMADPAAPDRRYAVVVSGYRAAGGGHIAALDGAETIPLPRIGARTALRTYLAATGPDRTPPPAKWGFAPMAATTVLVRTGPGAAPYLEDLGAILDHQHPLDGDGFLPLSLRLAR